MIRPSLIACAALALATGGVLVAQRGRPAADLVQGQHVFEHWCAPCHADQPRLAGTLALQTKYEGAVPAALEKRTDLSDEVIRHYVRNGAAWMAPFRKTEVSDAELAALSAYLTTPEPRRPKTTPPPPATSRPAETASPHG